MIASVHIFNRVKKKEVHHNWFLIVVVWQVKKGMDLGTTLPNHLKFFLKLLPMTISISWPICMIKQFKTQKISSKMQPTFCANTYDVTIFKADGMVQNINK